MPADSTVRVSGRDRTFVGLVLYPRVGDRRERRFTEAEDAGGCAAQELWCGSRRHTASRRRVTVVSVRCGSVTGPHFCTKVDPYRIPDPPTTHAAADSRCAVGRHAPKATLGTSNVLKVALGACRPAPCVTAGSAAPGAGTFPDLCPLGARSLPRPDLGLRHHAAKPHRSSLAAIHLRPHFGKPSLVSTADPRIQHKSHFCTKVRRRWCGARRCSLLLSGPGWRSGKRLGRWRR
jgi:hypothetical protein